MGTNPNQAYVDNWNIRYGIGQLVETILPNHKSKTTTRTKSKASLIGGVPYIFLDGVDKPVQVMKLKPLVEGG